MKAILFALLSIITYTCVCQETKKNVYSVVNLKDEIIYKKNRKTIDKLPTSYSRANLDILTIQDINGALSVEKYIVVEGNELIGSSYYTRTGSITVTQAKKLIKFLSYANDSIVSRVPINNEEIVLQLSDEFKAVVFNTNEESWSVCFTVDAYHKHNIYFKANSIIEVLNILMKAVKELE